MVLQVLHFLNYENQEMSVNEPTYKTIYPGFGNSIDLFYGTIVGAGGGLRMKLVIAFGYSLCQALAKPNKM